MNLVTVLLCLMVAWFLYTLMDSYRSMQKELREIRLKCIGSPTSQYTKDPNDSMKGTLIEGLTKLRNATNSI